MTPKFQTVPLISRQADVAYQPCSSILEQFDIKLSKPDPSTDDPSTEKTTEGSDSEGIYTCRLETGNFA